MADTVEHMRKFPMTFSCYNPQTREMQNLNVLAVQPTGEPCTWTVFDPTQVDPYTGKARQIEFATFADAMAYIRQAVTQALDRWIDGETRAYEQVGFYGAP